VTIGLEGSRKFAPVERELVFDIDLTDYDDVRTCGKGAHICNQCWPLMAVAIKVECYNPASQLCLSQTVMAYTPYRSF